MNDQMMTSPLNNFIERMPKVELHLHLEGAIRPATLLAIARRNNVTLPAQDEAALARLFSYRALHDFLTLFMALVQVLRHGEDFEQIAYELGEDLAAQQVRYAEVMVSPSQYRRRGLDLHEVVQGVHAGFARAQQQCGVRMNLIFDYGRQCGVEGAWQVLDVARQYVGAPLVGWSIGGDEVHYPPEPFAAVFAAAREAGLHTTAHAGEVAGPPSVWGALTALGARRIGHGIRAEEDPALLTALRQHGVALDVSLTSNLRTGAVPSLAQHPLRRLFDAGVAVTLNTDDPTLFNTTLCDEYRLAAQHFGFTADELVTLARNGACASFLPPHEREALARQLAAELWQLRAELGV